MFEFILPVAVGGLALAFGKKKPMDDKKAIELVFKNVGVGYKLDNEFKYPSLIDTDQTIEDRTTYIYQTTLGLPDKVLKPLEDILSKTLDKKIKLEYEKFLRITVFEDKTPKLVRYQEVPKRDGWVVPLGKNEEGWHFHDFDSIPHMTVAGTTRFGKTVNLKSNMTYLIENHPEDVEFLLIDLKGGLEFDRYKDLQQVRAVCKDPAETYNALFALHHEIAARMSDFLEKGYNNITETPIKKRLFVIVDEAAQLAPEKWMEDDIKKMMSACQWYLSELCRVSGGLGVRVIYATQYPTSDCLPRQVKMNSDIKISYRLSTGYASEVAIDEYGAEKLPSTLKGRALIKTHELREVQTPLITDKEMLRRVKQYVVKKRPPQTPGNDDSYEIG